MVASRQPLARKIERVPKPGKLWKGLPAIGFLPARAPSTSFARAAIHPVGASGPLRFDQR
jgi:hypothetical protein